jgi:protein O-GlcNAc transferase
VLGNYLYWYNEIDIRSIRFRKRGGVRPRTNSAISKVRDCKDRSQSERQGVKATASSKLDAQYRDSVSTYKKGSFGAGLQQCINSLQLVHQTQEEIWHSRSTYEAGLASLEARFLQEKNFDEYDVHAVGSHKPFLLTHHGENDRLLQYRYGRLISRVMNCAFPQFSEGLKRRARKDGQKLRVGILSAYFRLHSNWKIPLRGWLGGLANYKDQLELFGYHTGHEVDDITAEAATLCNLVSGSTNILEWASHIRDDNLDVLVLPEVGMDGLTQQLACLRLAPVQAASWGHPQTTGLATIDHFLSSELMEPANGQQYYTEKLVRLPRLSISYRPLTVTSSQVSRAELGLSDDAVIYWCCQSLFKYMPEHDSLFVDIATQLKTSRFLFGGLPISRDADAKFSDRVSAAFRRRGLNPDVHCRFLPHMRGEKFAALAGLSNVFLDCVTWSGCNSALEALNVDLPVVTLSGRFMRSRHSMAFLTTLGMPELIAANAQHMAEIAVSLGRDRTRRDRIAQRIRREKYRLFDDQLAIKGLVEYLNIAANAATSGTL